MAEQEIAAPEGQAAPAPVEGMGQAAWSPVTLGDQTFKTREELESAWKDSHFRQEDYTRKSQANAQLRKHFENKMKELEKREKDFQEKGKQYETYDTFLKNRPDVYNQLQQLLNRPPNAEVAYQRAESLVNDKTGELEKRLGEFEDWKRQQEVEREKQDVFSKLSQELPDFDPNGIEERLSGLQDANFEALARLIYHAGKGEQSPLKVEQEITNKLKQKGGVKTPPPQGSPPSNERKFNSIEEARNAALRDAQGG